MAPCSSETRRRRWSEGPSLVSLVHNRHHHRVCHVVIMNAIRTLDATINQLTATLDKHDKYTTQLKQTTYRDTDEYVDPDMFGANARPKYNPAPIFKTSTNFDESG